MSVTTVAAPAGTDRSATTTLRLALVAIAIAVLLGVSFLVGRVTADTSTGTTSIVPTAHTGGAVATCAHLRPC